jgi:hypothetical protein
MLAFSGELWRSQFSSYSVLFQRPVWHLDKRTSYRPTVFYVSGATHTKWNFLFVFLH